MFTGSSPFLLVLLGSTEKSTWPSLNSLSWIWGTTRLNRLRWQILYPRLYLLPPSSRLGAPRGRDRDGFPSISPHPRDRLLSALQRASSGPSTYHPEAPLDPRLKPIHPSLKTGGGSDQRSKGPPPRLGGGWGTQLPLLQAPLVRKDPQRGHSHPASRRPPPGPRAPGGGPQLEDCLLGTPGGPKAQVPESRGLTSSKTRVPSAGAGNGDGEGWGRPGAPEAFFPLPNREGHLDSPPLQLDLPPASKGEA